MFTKILTSSLLFLIAIGGFFVSMDIKRTTPRENIVHIELEISQIYANENGAGGAAVDEARAKAAAQASTSSDTKQDDWLKNAINAFNALLGVITLIVSPAIIFAGWLLSPDWTSGDLFGLRKPMHDIWVVVSNIVYFVYAILLIIIAVATIIGKENFNYKIMLPKMALGILMVPFTWWFVQWTVSLASIVTASTVSIPLEMIKEDNPYLDTKSIPKYYITDSTLDDKQNTENLRTSMNACGKTGGGPESECTSINQILAKGGGVYATLLIYSSQVFRLQDYKTIDSAKDGIKTAGQLLNGVIVGAVMFIIFGILVIALIMVLFVRAIKLWMYAMFSPLFTLHFVAGKEFFKEAESFSLKEFIGLCFMPAIVGIILSFGLMVVSVIQHPTSTAQTNVKCEGYVLEGKELKNLTGGCKLISLFGNTENYISRGAWVDPAGNKWSITIIKIADMTFVFKGKASNGEDEKTAEAIKGGLSVAGGVFGTIILDVVALIFIWMAFMAAKGVNKTISKVLDPFENMGKKVGEMAMSAPKYAPLPIPGGSVSGLNRTIDLGAQALDTHHRKKEEEAIGRFAPGLLQGTIKAEANAQYQSAMDTDKANYQKTREHVAKITSGNSSEREKNWDDVAKGLGKVVDTVRKEWKNLGHTLTDKQKEAYEKLITGDASAINSLGANDKEVIWRILQSSGAASSSSSSGADKESTKSGFHAHQAGDNYNFNFNGGPNFNIDKKIATDMSADEIAKVINANKDKFKEEHKVDLATITKMLKDTGRTGDVDKLGQDVYAKLDEKVKK